MTLTPDEILARTKAVQRLRPGIGWSMDLEGTITWPDDTQPTEEEIAAEIESPTIKVASVTPVQGRIALLNAGLLQPAQAAVDAAGGALAIWWEYATIWERNNPILQGMADTLGLTSEQVDQLFAAASQIE